LQENLVRAIVLLVVLFSKKVYASPVQLVAMLICLLCVPFACFKIGYLDIEESPIQAALLVAVLVSSLVLPLLELGCLALLRRSIPVAIGQVASHTNLILLSSDTHLFTHFSVTGGKPVDSEK
jgi:hypothetical protein